MKNGKKFDVLITWDEGLQFLDVWADAGCKASITEVEGVRHVFTAMSETNYHVYIDPRYDREYVKREIEAAILCRSEK